MKHKKETCHSGHMIIADCCGLGCMNCGVCKCKENQYGYIKETDGKITEFTIIYLPAMRQVGKIYTDEVECKEEVNRLNK